MTRADVPASVVALRDHFRNKQLQEVHGLKLKQLRVDPKKYTPENYLVSLTNEAKRAYPTPNLPVIVPIDPAAADAAIKTDCFNRGKSQSQERLDAVNENLYDRVNRLFIKVMSGWPISKNNGATACKHS